MLSASKKRYLLTIYALGCDGSEVQSKNIASAMGVKRPSTSKMLKILAEEDGLIQKEYYGTVQFTAEGAKVANSLYTTCQLLYAFFCKELGTPPALARQDAQVCLCGLSEASIERIARRVLPKDRDAPAHAESQAP